MLWINLYIIQYVIASLLAQVDMLALEGYITTPGK